MHNFFPSRKSSQFFGQLLKFSKKLPKENNHPIGEILPNLVILKASLV
jgi:hypothetical protein